MIRAAFYVGLERPGDTGPDADRALATISDTLEDLNIEGATIQSARGLWRGAVERSRVVTVLLDTEAQVRALGEALRQDFDQDTVLVTIEPVRVETVQRRVNLA